MSKELSVYRKQAGDLDGEAKHAGEALAEFRSLAIRSDADQDFAAEILRDVKAKHKALDEARLGVTRSLRDNIDTINSWFRPALSLLKEAETELKGKIAGYVREVAERNRLALEAAADAGTPEEATEALAIVKPTALPQGVSMRHVWNYAVTDVAKVPRRFLTVDHTAIREYLRDAGGEAPAEVEGLMFFQEEQLAVRGR